MVKIMKDLKINIQNTLNFENLSKEVVEKEKYFLCFENATCWNHGTKLLNRNTRDIGAISDIEQGQ